MNTNTTSASALGILVLISMLAFSGCSQKPSSEEIADQVKAAMAEEKAKEQAAAPAPAPTPPARAATPKASTRIRSIEQAKPAQAEPPAPEQKMYCASCGEVISVKEVEVAGKSSGLGVIAGGATGGLIGNQMGQGTGRDLATIAGVVGGAIAGNKIEQNIKKTRVYDVTVQMENGDIRVLRHETAPGVVAGDKVRIEGERIVRR